MPRISAASAPNDRRSAGGESQHEGRVGETKHRVPYLDREPQGSQQWKRSMKAHDPVMSYAPRPDEGNLTRDQGLIRRGACSRAAAANGQSAPETSVSAARIGERRRERNGSTRRRRGGGDAEDQGWARTAATPATPAAARRACRDTVAAAPTAPMKVRAGVPTSSETPMPSMDVHFLRHQQAEHAARRSTSGRPVVIQWARHLTKTDELRAGSTPSWS